MSGTPTTQDGEQSTTNPLRLIGASVADILRRHYFYTTLIKHESYMSPLLGWATVFGGVAILGSWVTQAGKYGPEAAVPVLTGCFVGAMLLYGVHFTLWIVSKLWRHSHGYGSYGG